MRTITVELRNNNALKLLKDLELANIIRVLDEGENKEETKLSTKLRGAISKERAQELSDQLKHIRNEWDSRNI